MVSTAEEISPVTERTRGSGCVEVHHRGGLNASIFEEDFIASVNRRNDSTRQSDLVCHQEAPGLFTPEYYLHSFRTVHILHAQYERYGQ